MNVAWRRTPSMKKNQHKTTEKESPKQQLTFWNPDEGGISKDTKESERTRSNHTLDHRGKGVVSTWDEQVNEEHPLSGRARARNESAHGKRASEIHSRTGGREGGEGGKSVRGSEASEPGRLTRWRKRANGRGILVLCRVQRDKAGHRKKVSESAMSA
jgi:hypothetical protein